MHRFLQHLWRLIIDETTGETRVPPEADAEPHDAEPHDAEPHDAEPLDTEALDTATARLLHRTIAAVREDFAALRFNTAIAQLITLTAYASRLAAVPRALAEPLVLMVAPLAPHVAEELWRRLGHPQSLAYEPFPQPDPALAADAVITLPVQVNGKVRFTVKVPAQASQDEIAALLPGHPDYPKYPREDVARLVIVPGKIVNVVLR